MISLGACPKIHVSCRIGYVRARKRAFGTRVTAHNPGVGDVSRIHDAMRARYGKTSQRVLDSLAFAATGQEYTRFHPGKGLQKASSYIEGLSAKPFHDVSDLDYEWLRGLERDYPVILDELVSALTNPQLSTFGNRIWAAAAREEAVAYGPDWKTLVLQDRCVWDETNASLFPKTVEILKNHNVPSVEAFFARQAPSTGIKPHSDYTNFILTSHLGLDVPEGQCWMKVGEFKKDWVNGGGMIVDTSFVHSTANESDSKTRYVLIIRFWHPELTLAERQALQFLFEALDDPSDEGIALAIRTASRREATLKSSSGSAKKGCAEHRSLGLLSKGMK
ncbi:Aspartyl/Asparaginyl beta-hydroxylase [Ostreococcus tauri]|uniref:Aspartyl/Asparaginyl beta-hydroxylase n=1 Tax=Ostreococcus tauri TaxID=70448 RepID=A0A090M790_OSTTA|nr:Aspartyl/Asparaginyl beta-hydroxylase [Ostreococcus tauri]CEG00908.1 Aspartyl/Asparaginyl beta-hydroxylase [Ostreococcus tauri]|eukprot:XP_003074751.2 Aspartyl/Asparaginyl beta-hydroxylase [Ostreococcus tauri]